LVLDLLKEADAAMYRQRSRKAIAARRGPTGSFTAGSGRHRIFQSPFSSWVADSFLEPQNDPQISERATR